MCKKQTQFYCTLDQTNKASTPDVILPQAYRYGCAVDNNTVQFLCSRRECIAYCAASIDYRSIASTQGRNLISLLYSSIAQFIIPPSLSYILASLDLY